MSAPTLTAWTAGVEITEPPLTVAVGPATHHEQLADVVSSVAVELWDLLREPSVTEWLEGGDPQVEVTLDADENELCRLYTPGDPDSPAPADFDLPRSGRPAPQDGRTFFVYADTAARVLTAALEQLVDLLIDARDDLGTLAEWVAEGAPCSVVEM